MRLGPGARGQRRGHASAGHLRRMGAAEGHDAADDTRADADDTRADAAVEQLTLLCGDSPSCVHNMDTSGARKTNRVPAAGSPPAYGDEIPAMNAANPRRVLRNLVQRRSLAAPKPRSRTSGPAVAAIIAAAAVLAAVVPIGSASASPGNGRDHSQRLGRDGLGI